MKDLKPTMKNAILSQCHECLGHYQDGRVDCENVRCPLYSWMPYRSKEPDLHWTLVHPKRRGNILLSAIDTSKYKSNWDKSDE
jgi:hypothetical protein